MTSYVLLPVLVVLSVLVVPTVTWTCTSTFKNPYGCTLTQCNSTCTFSSCDGGCGRCYGLSGSSCVACGANCNDSCNGFLGGCKLYCAVGWVVNTAHACVQCDIHCSTTPGVAKAGCFNTGAGKCDGKCMPAWTMSTVVGANTCLACGTNCIGTCDTYHTGFCDVGSCGAGYTVNTATHKCAACDPHCNLTVKSCELKGPGKCDKTCMTGFKLVTIPITNYTCVDIDECAATTPPCSGNATCLNTIGSFTCTCKAGYTGNGFSCTPICDTHCVALGCNGTGIGHCDSKCVKNYGLNKANHTCGACDLNCNSTCNNNGPTFCDGPCLSGFALNPSNYCHGCDPNCAVSTCKQFGAGTCDNGVCKAGYGIYAATHTCGNCSAHCTSGCAKTGAGECDKTCAKGYAIDNSTGAPICVACQDLCLGSCSHPGTCDGPCPPGYAVLPSTVAPAYNICLPCDPKCQNVTGSCDKQGYLKCDKTCVTGYALDGNHNCAPCGTNCLAGCTIMGGGYCDNTTIPACALGFGIAIIPFDPTKTVCYPCATNCNQCQIEGGNCCDGQAHCATGTTWQYDSTARCDRCL